ncbi:uncharacterized protein LOC135155913 [Lytechinus pictus]|uniref:uncharacterized protein LOC135155913 n=1 Tax=Lytechinus pictus TaxID=7653 RepID=UPI0030B9ED7C
MATPSYSKVMQSRKLWDGSRGTTLPPVAPTSKKPEGRPRPGLHRVQPPGQSKPRGIHDRGGLELPNSGRRRSMSFDDAYFQKAFAAQGQTHRNFRVSRPRAETNASRQNPSGNNSAIKEWDNWSDSGHIHGHKGTSALSLPGFNSHRDLQGEVRIRHPVMSMYKRSTYPYHTDSSSSLITPSSDYYFGYKGRSRHCHQFLEEKEVKHENTYRMDPRNNFHQVEGNIRRMMEDYLENTLDSLSANSSATAEEAAHAAKGLVESIKHQVKLQRLARYKIISLATICLKCGQDMVSSSRCVWDTKTDGFLSVTKQNKDWFGEVTVYAVYHE